MWTMVKDSKISEQFKTFHTYSSQRQSSYWPNIERDLRLKWTTIQTEGEKRRFERMCLWYWKTIPPQWCLPPPTIIAQIASTSLTHCSQTALLIYSFTETWPYLFPSLSHAPSFQSHLLYFLDSSLSFSCTCRWIFLKKWGNTSI